MKPLVFPNYCLFNYILDELVFINIENDLCNFHHEGDYLRFSVNFERKVVLVGNYFTKLYGIHEDKIVFLSGDVIPIIRTEEDLFMKSTVHNIEKYNLDSYKHIINFYDRIITMTGEIIKGTGENVQ